MLRQFWLRSWSEDLDVHTDDDMRIIADKAGMTQDQVSSCLDLMKTAGVKKTLKDVTEEAVDRGCFGSPTMFFSEDDDDEQMFWGSDRFEMVAAEYKRAWRGPDPR